MEFELLLPEDGQSIDTRTAALAQWCQGFLYGLGAGAIPDASELPGEVGEIVRDRDGDRKSTRLNSSHSQISYAVFCLKKKKYKHKMRRLSINSISRLL